MSTRHNPSRFFTLFAAIIAALFMCAASARAEDPAPPPSSSQPAPAQPAASATVKPAARREEVDPTTLAEAKIELKKVREDRDNAEASLTNEQASHEKTKGILKSTIETCKQAQADRDQFKASSEANLTGWNSEKAGHENTKGLLNLAEGALQVRGSAPSAAVPAAPEPAAKITSADFDARLKAEKDPAKRAAILAEFSKAAKEGRLS